MALNFELNYLIKELKEKKPKKVLIQLPEGMKQYVFEIIKPIEKLGIKVFVSGETAWGACAVSVEEAKNLGVDLIIHFGHAKFVEIDFPVLYIEVRDELNLLPLLNKSLEKLKKYKKFGLSYSIQHRHDIEKIKDFYNKNNKNVILSSKKGKVQYPGHIVGCQYSGLKEIEKDVECFVIIGNKFHALGAALSIKKPVILLDVYNDLVSDMSKKRDEVIKQRAISIDKLKKARNVGILVESKIGQKFGEPNFLMDKLKKEEKNIVIITINEITNEKLMNFYYIDCFIELGCPRIATDDFYKFEKPIVTFNEALVALGIISWKDFLKRGVL